VDMNVNQLVEMDITKIILIQRIQYVHHVILTVLHVMAQISMNVTLA